MNEKKNEPSSPTRRHAAGADPAKRAQILEGAERIFLDKSFATASVGDICAAAGVSKGTLYVYFQNKEDLFAALIEDHREKLFQGIAPILEGEDPVSDRLAAYGRRLAEVICSDTVIRAQRIMIGTIEQMPELGVRFYEGGAQRGQRILERCLVREVEAGNLHIADTSLAAYQFIELATAGLWRQRLFGKLTEPPTDTEIAIRADAAVRMFMMTYGGD
jgi:AcrR family transcriptional regulator